MLLLAVAFRRVTIAGMLDAVTVRQYGYIDETPRGAAAAEIRAITGDDWALDLRRVIPTGHIELSLAVEPWQILVSPLHMRLLTRSGADKLTDEDVARVAAHNSVIAVGIDAMRRDKFVRTRVLSSITPDPPWFGYLDRLGVTWRSSG